MKKKFKIITLGCRVNQYESEKIRASLELLGWKPASCGEDAELVIVNTCAVTQKAFKSSYANVKAALGKNTLVVAAGCAVQKEQKLFQTLRQVKTVLQAEKEKLIEKIFPETENKPVPVLKNFSGHARAFVKVQDGCNKFCSYCLIPFLRGRSFSRSGSEIIAEIKSLIANGFQEIVLTGIDLGDYAEGGRDLAALIQEISSVPGLKRLRLSSLSPLDLSDRLIDAICAFKVMPSLHLSLQSGSDRILKKMRRGYSADYFFKKLKALQEKDKRFVFTTDLIVGFPGETEDDFAKSLQIIEKAEFAKVHIFPFSVRENTLAAEEKKRVSWKEIKKRVKMAAFHADRAAFLKRQSFVGKKLEVLAESTGFGYSENFLKVKILPACKKNRLFKVKIVQNTEKYLVGKRTD